jgi:hypothetical protein
VDSIYVAAEFKTLLHNYNLVDGNYGLAISLIGTGPDNEQIVLGFLLDSEEDMLGDPYNYVSFLKQS